MKLATAAASRLISKSHSTVLEMILARSFQMLQQQIPNAIDLTMNESLLAVHCMESSEQAVVASGKWRVAIDEWRALYTIGHQLQLHIIRFTH